MISAHGPADSVPLNPRTEKLWRVCVTARHCARFRTSAIGRHRGVGGTRRSDSALSHRTTCLSHTASCCLHVPYEYMKVLNLCHINISTGRITGHGITKVFTACKTLEVNLARVAYMRMFIRYPIYYRPTYS